MAHASEAFFDAVRYHFGSLSQSQVDGINFLLEAWVDWDLRYCGYALATAGLETDRTMQPIEEYGSDAYFKDMYDIEGSRPDKAKELGNIYPGDGVAYHGRGYVQLTGRTNYERASNSIGHDFVNKPDDVMIPNHAANIMVRGMTEGWFTGKRLDQYFNDDTDDAYNARRIINGTDRAQEIAGYHKEFCTCLQGVATIRLYG